MYNSGWNQSLIQHQSKKTGRRAGMNIFRRLGYERVYLSLYQVADIHFHHVHMKGNDLISLPIF